MRGQEAISVVVARGDDAACDELLRLLTATGGLRVIGAARNGDEAIALARQTQPDIVLVDVDLPMPVGAVGATGGGIATTEALSSLLPGTGLILLARQMDAGVLQHAMMAGAREFLRLPAEPAEVVESIRRVHTVMAPHRSAIQGGGAARPVRRDGQVIAVFSPGGGVGRTTLATNIAVAMRCEHRMNVALVDASLPFGDIGVFLDLPPTHSIVDLQVSEAELDADYVDTVLLTHKSGVKALLSPPRPEMSEMVTDELLRRALRVLRERHDYVVVDTSPTLDERVLTTLEVADKILLVFPPNLSAIKSAKAFLEVANLLQFPPDKVTPVVTRATTPGDITIADVEATLGRPIEARIPTDERAVTHAINVGDPLLLSAEGTPIALAIADLARRVLAETHPEAAAEALIAQTSAPRPRQFKLFRSS